MTTWKSMGVSTMSSLCGDCNKTFLLTTYWGLKRYVGGLWLTGDPAYPTLVNEYDLWIHVLPHHQSDALGSLPQLAWFHGSLLSVTAAGLQWCHWAAEKLAPEEALIQLYAPEQVSKQTLVLPNIINITIRLHLKLYWSDSSLLWCIRYWHVHLFPHTFILQLLYEQRGEFFASSWTSQVNLHLR